MNTYPQNHNKGLGSVANKETTPKVEYIKNLEEINSQIVGDQVVLDVSYGVEIDLSINRSYYLNLLSNSNFISFKNLGVGLTAFIIVKDNGFSCNFVGVQRPESMDFKPKNLTLYKLVSTNEGNIILTEKEYTMYGPVESEFSTEEFSSGDIHS